MTQDALVVYVFRGPDVAVKTGQRNLGYEVIVVYETVGVNAEAGSEGTVAYCTSRQVGSQWLSSTP